MDRILREIAGFATACTYEGLPPTTIHAARDRLVDSLGCALGAQGSDPVRAAFASDAARASMPNGGGWIIGGEGNHTHSFATFANTTMIRYLDFNDWAPYGHPSDCIGALLAFSHHDGVDSRDLITATAVAYDVYIGLTESAQLVQNGWDQGYTVGLSVIAGLGNLLRVDAEIVAHALSMYACSGIAFGVVRLGEVSEWKACATAFSAQNAVAALDFARAGIDAPLYPFSGRNGVFEAVTGPFDIAFPLATGGPGRIEGTSLKYWPGCYHIQAPLWAALALHGEVPPSEIASIGVHTYGQAHKITASDDNKWNPMTRETADHSMPYAIARALHDGAFSNSAYENSAFRDREVLDTMQKVSVHIDEDLGRDYPNHVRVRLDVTDHRGELRTREVSGPSGHPDNPMTSDQLRAKFLRLAADALGGRDRAEAAFEAWHNLTNDDGALSDARASVAGSLATNVSVAGGAVAVL